MTTTISESQAATLAELLPYTLAWLTELIEDSVSEEGDDENGFQPHWEPARRYYESRKIIADAMGKQPYDILCPGDMCKWAKARRDETN